MMIFSEDIDVARSILAMIASYTISLLEAGKSRRMACSILSPVGALSCRPTPTPVFREALFTLRIHQPLLLESASYWGISSKKSSIDLYPFNAKQVLYRLSNSLSLVAHRTIIFYKSGLCIVLCKGRLVSTTIRYSWK